MATKAAASISAGLSGLKQRNWQQFSEMEWRDIVNKSRYLDDSTRKYFNTTQGIDKLIEAMRASGGKMSTFESIITAVMLSQMSIPTPNVNYQSGPSGVNYNFGF